MNVPFKNQALKIQRSAKLVQILTKHGFDQLAGYWDKKHSAANNIDPTTIYVRIRLVIEELGPTFIKFGQTLSSREDLLPSALIAELKKLQDDVAPQDINISALFEQEFALDPVQVFSVLNTSPLASASIAQAYSAVLHNGQKVILKVKRPDIRATILSDLLILSDIIDVLTSYVDIVRKINLRHIFQAFKKTLIEELSFINEAKNIRQFAHNFKGNNQINCIKVYDELSNDNIICLSFAEGVNITNKEMLSAFGIDFESVVDKGLDLYLTQVLEHGFFHADPHPGNILVNRTGIISFLDFGAMGSMLPPDKEDLENFITQFINKDVDGLIFTIKKMAVSIEIDNEKTLQRDIQQLFDIINSNTLEEIDIKDFLRRFSGILNQNNIIMPEHIYLLVRGIVIIEGIGRELVPGLNIVEKIKPYIDKIIRRKLSFENIQSEITSRLYQMISWADQLPKSGRSIIHQLEQGELTFKTHNKDLSEISRQIRKNASADKAFYLACIAFLCCAIFALNDRWVSHLGLPFLSWASLLTGIICLIYYKISRLKN